MVFLELAVVALPIAERLLYRFLDGPERQLRKKGLRNEIDTMIDAQVQQVSKTQFTSLREAVYQELQIIVDQLPEVEWSSAPRGLNPVVINRPKPKEDTTATLRRLATAVEARRKILSTDSSEGIGQGKPPTPSGREGGELDGWIKADSGNGRSERHDSVTADAPGDEAPPGWVETEGAKDRPSRLDDLRRRIERRRSE